MSQITHRRLRLAANSAGFDTPRDQMTGRSVRIFRGASYRFEIASFFGAPGATTLITDVSNWAMVKLEIKAMRPDNVPPDPADSPLVSKTVNTFNSALTWTQWDTSRDNQHVVIEATKGEMAVPVGGKAWLVIEAFTNDSPSHLIPLLAGQIEVVEDGYQEGGTPPAPVVSYYTDDEVDAMFASELDLNYVGAWDASGGTLPSTAGRAFKDYYLISVQGTISGVLHRPTDRLIYSGSAWVRVPGIGAYAGDAQSAAAAATASAAAAAASATSASASASSATASATTASTQASNASASATAASGSASSAAGSATAASGSASTAATQAGNAATSATAAAGSASAASTSATAASGSAATASTQAASASTRSTAAAASATQAAGYVGNVMVLVGQTTQTATFTAGDNITVANGSGPYASAIITFPA